MKIDFENLYIILSIIILSCGLSFLTVWWIGLLLGFILLLIFEPFGYI